MMDGHFLRHCKIESRDKLSAVIPRTRFCFPKNGDNVFKKNNPHSYENAIVCENDTIFDGSMSIYSAGI